MFDAPAESAYARVNHGGPDHIRLLTKAEHKSSEVLQFK